MLNTRINKSKVQTNFIENTKLKEKMMNQDYMGKLVAGALDEEFTTEALDEVKSTIEYKQIVGDNKGKLPFKGARWVPLPREFSGKLGILNQGLEVSDSGVICTPNGLIKANINTREKWKALAGGVNSLRLWRDPNTSLVIHDTQDGPMLKLKTTTEIALKKIVATAFVPNPEGKTCVAVLNGDIFDMRAENLMWMTRSEINMFARNGVLPAEVKQENKDKDLTFGLGFGGRFDYSTRTLYIDVPLSEYNGLMYRLEGISKRKVVFTDAAKMYFLIKFWSNFEIRDFGIEDLMVHLGVSRNTLQNLKDFLIEDTKIVTYDKELWKKYMGSFEYYVEECPKIDITGSIRLSYSCSGTRIEETLILFVKSLRNEIFTPEYKDKWDELKKMSLYTLPEWYYESKYGELKYRYTTSPDDLNGRIKENHFVSKCVSNLKKPFNYTETSGRAWPAFARSNREYRYGFEYKGSPLTEVVDIHCSFYTLLTHLLKDKVPEAERLEYFENCISGKLYDDCAEYINKNRSKGKVSRDDAKEYMQAWRNDIKGTRSLKKVHEFMEYKYPNIKKVIDEWPTFRDKKNITHKTLQRECGAFETRLMSDLARELTSKYEVECFLLHDAIFMSEADVKKLPADIHEQILNWFKINILN